MAQALNAFRRLGAQMSYTHACLEGVSRVSHAFNLNRRRP